MSVVVRGPDLSELHSDLTYLMGTSSLQAASLNSLSARWPPKGLMREAKARRGRSSLFGWVIRVALETLLAFFIVRFKMKLGPFDSEQYRQEVVDNAVDFARSDDMMCLTFDCPESRFPDLESYFEVRAKKGELNYGIHKSDHAVMTCLVANAIENQHVHFIDGGDGGYTMASKQLKAQLDIEA